jgi:L-threonylcarbamoyladenylate synthase
LYGVVARASDEEAVKRVYRVRGRAPNKPCIILVAGRADITDNELWTPAHKKIADTYWPGPLSLVAPTKHTRKYLHRGTHTLAYRVPAREDLRQLLALTGPLVAPSANPEGNPPATTLDEAQAYFGDYIDGYVDGGLMAGHAPSTLVAIQDGQPKVLRAGALEIK